ncbi:restriction endonuclease subunit S [Nocardiopsis sp. JB363]|uniref:restriction endonuclease subunit S n=1 Tax=Nocardiopsis sp. JB363 TaxID=1434837 RepID=UPI00097B768E|nr:restriction endonuclease subunit S [Nocardiopsis sp. JB363]SIO85089.1 Type I restriction-modification system, specificity subunit S [Nocardiopsis sp. JB363]
MRPAGAVPLRHTSLGTVAEIKAGPSGARLKELGDHPRGLRVITPADFTEAQRVDSQNVRRVPEREEKPLEAYRLEEGDLLVVRQGALGRLAVIEPDQRGWVYGSSCLRVRIKSSTGVDPSYLAAYLSQPRTLERLKGPALSSTIPSFNATALRDLEIAVPESAQQERIVATLNDMDEAIAARLAVVERMKALRPSVFEALLEGESS